MSEIVNFSRGQGLSWSDVDDKNGKFECVLYGNLYTDYDTIISKIAHKSKIKGSVLSKKFDVLMPASDTTPTGLARALCIINSGISLGGDINILSPIRDNGMCIAYSLNHHKSELIKRIKGTTVRHLQKGDIEDLKIPLPINMEEQAKISEYLYKLDNLITLHQRKYEKLLTMKKSCLEKMFPKNENKINKIPEIRFKGFTDAWEQRKLSSIATMHARIGWQNLRTSEFLDRGNYYLITGTDFIDGEIDLKTCHFVEKERYDQDKNIQIKNGSILITKDGTLGKVAYVEGLDKPATLNAGVFNVVIIDKNMENKYLFHYLKAPFLMDYVGKRATGGTIKHLNQNILVDFPVIHPSYDEQTKIGAFFSKLDNLITLHQRKVKMLQNIKKSCLEKMFL